MTWPIYRFSHSITACSYLVVRFWTFRKLIQRQLAHHTLPISLHDLFPADFPIYESFARIKTLSLACFNDFSVSPMRNLRENRKFRTLHQPRCKVRFISSIIKNASKKHRINSLKLTKLLSQRNFEHSKYFLRIILDWQTERKLLQINSVTIGAH